MNTFTKEEVNMILEEIEKNKYTGCMLVDGTDLTFEYPKKFTNPHIKKILEETERTAVKNLVAIPLIDRMVFMTVDKKNV